MIESAALRQWVEEQRRTEGAAVIPPSVESWPFELTPQDRQFLAILHISQD